LWRDEQGETNTLSSEVIEIESTAPKPEEPELESLAHNPAVKAIHDISLSIGSGPGGSIARGLGKGFMKLAHRGYDTATNPEPSVVYEGAV
jgi:hypothetical protein